MLERKVLVLIRIAIHQEVDVGTKTHLGEHLYVWIAFLERFVNEDTLSIKHFVVQLIAVVSRRIMSKDYSLISFMQLSSPQSFDQQWRSIDQENLRKPINIVPNILWNRLDWCDDYNLLLLFIKILGSQWQYKVLYGRVETTNNYMVFKVKEK